MSYGTSCVEPSDPWIGRCKYDAAYDLLQHIYADLKVNITIIARQIAWDRPIRLNSMSFALICPLNFWAENWHTIVYFCPGKRSSQFWLFYVFVLELGAHIEQTDGHGQYNTIQYNNSICRALFTKRPGALTETSDDMLCEIVQSLNGA